ncbi:ATP-binding cassette sub-family B member 10, mitochondrial-like isoform X2 [Convolutriloba macropyga]|uniref:ATP-binding cassette sub-family B member 10, mitochondrial-like isoform X2 n=1 Tax=Convolutriloba macropyga TaxID=536237 RepID=UPI003F5218BF
MSAVPMRLLFSATRSLISTSTFRVTQLRFQQNYRKNEWIRMTANTSSYKKKENMKAANDNATSEKLNLSSNGGTKVQREDRFSHGKRLLSIAKPERLRIGMAIGFLSISSGVTLSVPYFIGTIIDTIYTLSDKALLMQNLQSVAAWLVGLFVVGAAANGARIYLIESSGQRIIQRLRNDVFRSLIRADVSFFDQSQTGELLNRLSSDTEVVGSSLTYNISDGMRSTLQVLGGLSLMVYTSAKLSIAVMVILPPVVLTSMMFGRYLKKISRQVQDSLALSTEFAEERLSNMRLVKAFAREETERRVYGDRVNDVYNVASKEVLGHSLFYMMNGFAGNLMILSVFYFGGMMVHDSSLSVGGLSSFILYSTYVGMSIGGLSNFYAELMKAVGASTRIWEIMDNQPLIPLEDGKNSVKADNIQGKISFRDVTFNYPSRPDLPVLDKFSLEVESGKVTALVGKSGCGKSTVASLIMRLYDPNEGAILVDGKPLEQYSLKDFRSRISFVSQDPAMFSCSIRENIEYGSVDPDCVPFERVREAAEVANCHDFISSFPHSYDTLVGQRGVMLSGGQRQRLAIARAIIRDPTILVLDEATSALDSESEQLVQDALKKILPGRTVIQIAHRLASIRNAHSIAVIDEGKVVEQGSYEQLMAIPNGHLSELVNLQILPEGNASLT